MPSSRRIETRCCRASNRCADPSPAAIVLLAAAFYLLLIDTTDLPELYALAAVALLAGLGFALTAHQGLTDAVISPRWLLRAWRPLAGPPGTSASFSAS